MSLDSRIGLTGSGVPRELRDALAQLASTDRLLVALDFDGTLAPEVDDPATARALPEAKDAVIRLNDLPRTRVALVSGRGVRDLEAVTDLSDEILLVGSHGIELRLDSPDVELALDDAERASMVLMSEMLEQVADNVDQVWIEPKPAGFALHTRLATEKDSRIAHLVARSELSAEIADLTVREGKNVLEFSVRSTTKGEAVEYLRRYTKSTAAFFAGDDVTDEDAFVALGPDDLGVKSGPGTTAADFRVPGPEQIAHVLHLLADLRAAFLTQEAPSN